MEIDKLPAGACVMWDDAGNEAVVVIHLTALTPGVLWSSTCAQSSVRGLCSRLFIGEGVPQRRLPLPARLRREDALCSSCRSTPKRLHHQPRLAG